MASDAVALIKDDHRRMEQLFARLKTGDGDRRALVAEVEVRLIAHARAEESEVYPTIAKKAGEQDEVEHGNHEHFEAEHHLRKVINLIDSPHFDQALEEFVAAVDHHVQEEESELLPALQKAVGKQALAELGTAFERARLDHLRAAGHEESTTSAELELTDATRDELYEKAKEADVPGRSHMKKDELIEALREQPSHGK
ncbi:hemerythrin domain-containing protein [Actinoplanes sp. NPDC051475]|uniref:hemerythrin domain-containing protein n=1 Tax=Actinoplanes sp. NPDC051475 TaxID=3157225 RepID=UPI00344B5611